MLAKGRITISIFLLCLSSSGFLAQHFSNTKDTLLPYYVNRVIFLDTNSIVPHSIKVYSKGKELTTDSYLIDYWNATFRMTTQTSSDSVRVVYQTFPLSFTKPFYHKRAEDYIQPTETKNPFTYEVNEAKGSIWSSGALSKQGSISRGISFGNNQDLSVSSNLNLQLAGKISDEVQILAAITDENIPIQPEGNTQQLQDFDQVYMQLFNNHHKLTAGDFQLKENAGHFMRYFKKAQGLSYNYQSTENPEEEGLRMRLSGAASRGKFSRYFLQQVEGKQGPYRLKGAENERFLIVLSGTERIYIDGELLTRGVENDYVIDYNTAEVTFTPNRLITKDRRILVEFQYTDRNYVRTLADFSLDYQKKGLETFFKFYTEQDLKNQPINESITDEKRFFLENLGDDLDNALYSSEDSVGFSDNRILYEKKDSLGYEVFDFSNNPELAIYAVTFSEVANNIGDYVQASSNANGKVFKWIKPDTINGEIVHYGTHAPLELLNTPKQRQLITTGIGKRGETGGVFFEGALSKNDINTFSKKDAGDDYGYAIKVNGFKEKKITEKAKLVGDVSYEWINRNFKEVEWFRNAEFARDWNILNVALTNNQHITNASAGWHHKTYGQLLQFSNQVYFSEHEEFMANKNQLLTNAKVGNLSLISNSSLMNSSLDQTQTTFLRNKSLASYRVGVLTFGVRDDYEHNEFFYETDSLLLNSYQFLEWEAFVKSEDTLNNSFYASYVQRNDRFPKHNSLVPASTADHINLNFALFQSSPFKLKTRTTYRNLKILDPEVINVDPEQTLLNRIEYSAKLIQGFLNATSFYQLGSGFETKKEFTFVQVASGQGNYTWIDYDSSGTKELNEFEIAIFQDQANYIKVFSPTNEFIKTKNNQFSQSVYLQPDKIIKTKKWYAFLARFSNQLAYSLEWKSTAQKVQETMNPFNQNINDTSLLALNRIFRNSFFFNRKSPKFGATFNYQNNGSKVLSVNGFEWRNNTFYEGLLRLNLFKLFLLEGKYLTGIKLNENDFFASRNYQINYQQIEPKLNIQPSVHLRFSVAYQLSQKNNLEQFGGEIANSQSLNVVTRYSEGGKSNLEGNIKFVNITYTTQSGEQPAANTTIAFDMLEGLNPGRNFLWALNYQRTIGNNTQVSILYNARKPEGNKIIHNAGAEVRVFF